MPHTPLGRLAMRYGAEHALIVVNHGRRTDPQSQVVAAAEMAYDSGHGATYIGNIAVRPSERGLNHGLTILYEEADASLARDIGLIITTFADLEDPQLALQFGFSAPEEADVDPQLEGRLTARPEVVFGHAMQNMSSGSRIFPFTAGPSRWE